MKLLSSLVLFGLLAASRLPAEEIKPATLLVVKAAHFVDPVAGTTKDNQVVLIEGDKVKAVGTVAEITAGLPPDTKIIDLGNATILPGLIDCHTHLSSNPGNYYESFRRSAVEQAVVAPNYARRTLLAGFTTVRDVGSSEYIDMALRRAINTGAIPGPRMLCCGAALSATGGHGDINGFSPAMHFDRLAPNVADGPEAIRLVVRNNVKYGADWIKILASAGVLSEEESVGRPQYSFEEMKAAVDEAALWGRKVAAHAHGPEAIKMAVRAGVTSIEHCSLVDDEGIQLMKENGTWLVPTIYCVELRAGGVRQTGLPGEDSGEGAARGQTADRDVPQGRAGGGTHRVRDGRGRVSARAERAGVSFHGRAGNDADAGDPSRRRRARRTWWAGRGKSGQLTPGAFADLIAVNADPVADIRTLENVPFVVKGGVLYKNTLTADAVVKEE